eukprot:tig00000718_g3693.t1
MAALSPMVRDRLAQFLGLSSQISDERALVTPRGHRERDLAILRAMDPADALRVLEYAIERSANITNPARYLSDLLDRIKRGKCNPQQNLRLKSDPEPSPEALDSARGPVDERLAGRVELQLFSISCRESWGAYPRKVELSEKTTEIVKRLTPSVALDLLGRFTGALENGDARNGAVSQVEDPDAWLYRSARMRLEVGCFGTPPPPPPLRAPPRPAPFSPGPPRAPRGRACRGCRSAASRPASAGAGAAFRRPAPPAAPSFPLGQQRGQPARPRPRPRPRPSPPRPRAAPHPSPCPRPHRGGEWGGEAGGAGGAGAEEASAAFKLTLAHAKAAPFVPRLKLPAAAPAAPHPAAPPRPRPRPRPRPSPFSHPQPAPAPAPASAPASTPAPAPGPVASPPPCAPAAGHRRRRRPGRGGEDAGALRAELERTRAELAAVRAERDEALQELRASLLREREAAAQCDAYEREWSRILREITGAAPEPAAPRGSLTAR